MWRWQPKLAQTGTAPILNGIDGLAVEAAGEFALDRSLSAILAATVDTAAAGNRRLEILIRVRAIGGAARAHA